MIPVYLITGFLGSGKTTLLNHLLRDAAMVDTAVIINEFGDVAIDHLLVETSIENTLVLQSGCICCTIRGDLVDTLADLERRAAAGDIPAFSRVALETTGLADPVPVMQTLATDLLVCKRYRLAGTIVTVDAVNGAAQLGRFPEAVKQAALADLLLVTKTDLADAAATADLRRKLADLNPTIVPKVVLNGAFGAQAMFDALQDRPGTKKDWRAWLGADAIDAHGSHHDSHHGHHHHDPNRHGADIVATCLTFDEPLERDALFAWLDALISLRGQDVLRLKGIVAFAGEATPTVLQGVQHVVQPPRQLDAWPDADRRTRLVLITRDIAPAALEKSLAAASAVQSRRPEGAAWQASIEPKIAG